jgi:hypothetical protein
MSAVDLSVQRASLRFPDASQIRRPGSGAIESPNVIGLSWEAARPTRLSADQVGQCGRHAAIRHMNYIDFRHDLEQFGGQVGHGANASRSEVDFARIGFGMGNKFGDCLGRKRWAHHQDMRATGDTRDRCDIAEKTKLSLSLSVAFEPQARSV